MTTNAINTRTRSRAGFGRTLAWVVIALLVSGMGALIAALAGGGGAVPQPLQDPGPIVRWGLPVVKLVYNLSAAATIGALLFILTVLPDHSAARARASRVLVAGSISWATSSALSLVLAFASLVPVSGFDSIVLDQFTYFATAIPLGQVWLANTLITSLIAVLGLFIGRPGSALALLVFAFAALLPMAATGHAAGSPNHGAAVTALALHIGGAATWVGGLLLLAITGPMLGSKTTLVAKRFSTIALACFITVAASGLVAALINIGNLDNLGSAYGGLLIIKATVLVLLGAAGAWNRTRLIRRIGERQRRSAKKFWSVIAGEIILIGSASGIAAGLARTPAPESESATLVSPAEALTGRSEPPPLSALTAIVEWDFDLLWTLLCSACIILYLAGVRRLLQRRIEWPASRTLFAVLGFLTLFYLTNGSAAVYQEFSFGTNLATRLIVCLIVPLLLIPARPAQLIRRAATPRGDGTVGAKKVAGVLQRLMRMAFIRSAPMWSLIVIGSFFAVYLTPLLEWTIRDPYGYQLTTIYFLGIGALLTKSIYSAATRGMGGSFYFAVGTIVGGLAALGVMVSVWPETLGASWFSLLETDQYRVLDDQRSSAPFVWAVTAAWSALTLAMYLVARKRTATGLSEINPDEREDA